MPDKIEFSPAIAVPVPFDVKKRIQELRDCLDPKHPHYECEQQHVNIKAAIQLYEDGKIDGSEAVFIMEGKVITEQELYEGTTWTWVEETCYEFAEKHAYDHGTLSQLSDGTVHRITVVNDTGSARLSLRDTDLHHLGNLQGYTGWEGYTELVRDDDSPWSKWISERALIKPVIPGVPRLSGNRMRDVLYTGTAPGNHFLAVAATKGGMTSLL